MWSENNILIYQEDKIIWNLYTTEKTDKAKMTEL